MKINSPGLFSRNIYRPQRSCGQGNIFTPVCHSVHGGECLPQCMLGYHTPWEQTPPPVADTLPEHTPPRADTPQSRHPPEQTPWEQTPPRSRHHPPWSRHPPPPQEADSGIRSMSGRYAYATGMHSCYILILNNCAENFNKFLFISLRINQLTDKISTWLTQLVYLGK